MDIVEKILNGPDYFYCERFRVRMRKAVCVDRQDRLQEAVDARGPNSRFPYDAEIKLEQCGKCGQGKKISDELRVTSDESGVKKFERREEEMETEKTRESPIMCKRCGERPAMVRRDTGSVVNGYCGMCAQQVRKENVLKNMEKGKGMKSPSVPLSKRGKKWQELNMELLRKMLAETGLLERVVRESENQFRSAEGQVCHYVREGLRSDQAVGCLDPE